MSAATLPFAGQRFQSPQQVFARGGMDAVRADTVDKIELLRELGLNMNLAPVADVSTNPSDLSMTAASAGRRRKTAAFIRTSVNVYEANGFSYACLSIFPVMGTMRTRIPHAYGQPQLRYVSKLGFYSL